MVGIEAPNCYPVKLQISLYKYIFMKQIYIILERVPSHFLCGMVLASSCFCSLEDLPRFDRKHSTVSGGCIEAVLTFQSRVHATVLPQEN